MEANAQGLRCTRQVVNMLADQTFENSHLEEEKEIIRQETRAIVEKCFELGEGDIALGVSPGSTGRGSGCPLCSLPGQCQFNAAGRDNDGAVRILNMGNLPFPRN